MQISQAVNALVEDSTAMQAETTTPNITSYITPTQETPVLLGGAPIVTSTFENPAVQEIGSVALFVGGNSGILASTTVLKTGQPMLYELSIYYPNGQLYSGEAQIDTDSSSSSGYYGTSADMAFPQANTMQPSYEFGYTPEVDGFHAITIEALGSSTTVMLSSQTQ
jgi:hypothetical protein